MPTPMNKTRREAIRDAIITKTFAERVAALRAKYPSFALRLYESVIPADFRKLSREYPAEWFKHHAQVHARKHQADGGKIISFEFPLLRGDSLLELPGPRPFPHNHTSRYSSPDCCTRDTELIAEIQEHIAAEQALCDERDAMRTKLEALLAGCRTVEKLVEIAPELEPYLPPEAKAEQRANLPAVVAGNVIADLMKSGLKIPADSSQ